MKFSIRDLLLVTVIVALGFGWSADRQRLILQYNALLTRAAKLENDARYPAGALPNSSAPAPNPPKP